MGLTLQGEKKQIFSWKMDHLKKFFNQRARKGNTPFQPRQNKKSKGQNNNSPHQGKKQRQKGGQRGGGKQNGGWQKKMDALTKMVSKMQRRPGNGTQDGEPTQSARERKCHNCNQMGHIKRDCPNSTSTTPRT